MREPEILRNYKKFEKHTVSEEGNCKKAKRNNPSQIKCMRGLPRGHDYYRTVQAQEQ